MPGLQFGTITNARARREVVLWGVKGQQSDGKARAAQPAEHKGNGKSSSRIFHKFALVFNNNALKLFDDLAAIFPEEKGEF
jgi:hypothetical protein